MLRLENNPPFFFILLHFWIKIVGISPFSVRFLPMLFSSVTAVLIYIFGNKFLNRRTGITAALIFTFSNYHLTFAHEARVYSLFALLSVLSMIIFFTLRDKRSVVKIIALALINALLLYSHFFGFFLILTQAVICLFINDFRRSSGLSFLLSAVLSFLCYVPYLPMLLFRYNLTLSLGTWVQPPVITDLYTMVWRYSNLPMTTVVFLIIIGAGTLFFFCRKTKISSHISRSETKAVMLWFFFPYLLMFLISFRQPIFLDRYTIFVSVGYYLLVAACMEFIFRSTYFKAILSALAVILMMLFFTPDVDNKRNLREAVDLVKSVKTNETAVIICPSWLEYGFTYYYNPGYFKDYAGMRTLLNNDQIFPVDSIGQMKRYFKGSNTRVIYFEEWAKWIDKEEEILHSLDSAYTKISQNLVYERYMVHMYIKK